MTVDTRKPRPAATVVVVRRTADVPELFMMRRHARAVFASYYVFPGGVVDPDDSLVHHRASGVDARQANQRLGVAGGALDYYSAGIREAFEESGILFARDASGNWAFGERGDDEVRNFRCLLNAGKLAWPDFLRQHALTLSYESLHYIDYWVTPKSEARRFSTRFFLAVKPDGQEARHDDAELIDSCWMSAKRVLAAGRQGEMQLMMPTVMNLERIARYDNVESLVAWASARAGRAIVNLPPVFPDDERDLRAIMPGSPDYPCPDDVDR